MNNLSSLGFATEKLDFVPHRRTVTCQEDAGGESTFSHTCRENLGISPTEYSFARVSACGYPTHLTGFSSCSNNFYTVSYGNGLIKLLQLGISLRLKDKVSPEGSLSEDMDFESSYTLEKHIF